MSPAATCPNVGCAARFDSLVREIDELQEQTKELRSKQGSQGERLATIEGRLALAAAFGATMGGGIVTALSKFLR